MVEFSLQILRADCTESKNICINLTKISMRQYFLKVEKANTLGLAKVSYLFQIFPHQSRVKGLVFV